MPQNTHLRRVPQQERSEQRVSEILDAAAELFSELGYEATTTNAIAERAGVAIGTLYRYFQDKEAILRAFAKRRQEQIHTLYQELFTPDLIYLPLPVALDRLIDPFVELHLQYPGFKEILLGADVSPEIAEASEEMDSEIIRRIADFLKLGAPYLTEEEAEAKATICKVVVKSLISLIAATDDVALHQQACEEIKAMLQLYLETLFGTGRSHVS